MKLFDEIKKNLKFTIKDRFMLLVMVGIFLAGTIFFWTMLAGSQYFDRLIYARYTVFGGEHFYKESWTYRLVLAFFGAFVAIFHPILVSKIYKNSGKRMAVFFSIFSAIVLILGWLIVGVSLREIPN